MQDKSRYLQDKMRWAVFPGLLIVFAFQAYACRGLYADGVNFFFHYLCYDWFPWWDGQRIINHIVTLAPLSVALKMGVHQLVFLRYLFSTWLLACPLLVWAAVFWTIRRDVVFWPVLLLFCFVYYGSNFFAIGEYNLCFALAAYCFVCLMLPLPPDRLQRAGLLVAACLLPLEYPSVLFLASLLLVATLIKPAREWGGASRFYRLALAFIFLLAVAFALYEVLMPRDPHQMELARNPAALQAYPAFWCVMLYGILAIALFWVHNKTMQVIVTLICFGLLLALIFDTARFYPGLQHGVRAYVGIGYAVLGIGIWWFRRRILHDGGLERERRMPLPPALAMLLFTILSIFDVQGSLGYARYLHAFRDIVNARSGLISYEMSTLPFVPGASQYLWMGTVPMLSVVLREDEDKAIILDPAAYNGPNKLDARDNVPRFDKFYH